MRSKMKSVRGFTLAELLIVVAIIGVLVAIAIPVFTSQLERSREAVDLSDVRSAYAEVMMAAITGDTMATYTKNSSETIWKNNGDYSITVKPLKQQKDGWQTPLPITIGGVSSGTGEKSRRKSSRYKERSISGIKQRCRPVRLSGGPALQKGNL